MKHARKENSRVCFVLTAVLLALSAVLLIVLISAKLLPVRYLVLIGAGSLLLTAAAAVLLRDREKRGPFRIGVGIWFMTALVLAVGSFAAARSVSTLGAVTTPEVQVAHIGVYVRAEDPAESLGDLSGYRFGILEQLNREAVDATLAQTEAELGGTVSAVSFETPVDLIDGLFASSVDAVVMNDAYLDLLADEKAYSDVFDRVREVQSVEVALEDVKEDKPAATPDVKEEPAVDGPIEPFLLYISGVDSRQGLNVASRSDVNILAAVNPAERQVFLLSTPRDYCMPLSVSNGELDKLTHAGTYGVQVSIDTLEMFYGIDIDYYFRVHFKGFRAIIDALGGILVDSDYAFTARLKPEYQYHEGLNYLNGDKALHFARERYAFVLGDVQRGKNQMKVIQAVLDKMTSPAILANYLSLLEAVEGNFETTVPYDLIAALVRQQLDDPGDWDVVTYTVTGSDATIRTYTYGMAYVMMPDEAMVETARGLLRDVLSGKRIEQPD